MNRLTQNVFFNQSAGNFLLPTKVIAIMDANVDAGDGIFCPFNISTTSFVFNSNNVMFPAIPLCIWSVGK